MPNVANLGARDGGVALRITFPMPAAGKYPGGKLPPGVNELTLVIDPATSTVITWTKYEGTTRLLTAEWTDHIAKIITDPPTDKRHGRPGAEPK
jgi:hypothetical protein